MKNGSGRGQKQETRKLPSVEEAIAAWESDGKRNPEGNKIVRDLNGKPVEVVLVTAGNKPVFAIVVNDTQEKFQIGGSMKSMEEVMGELQFRQFWKEDVFNRWYELKGVQRLDAQVNRNHQGFVFGLPGPQPLEMKVGIRAA